MKVLCPKMSGLVWVETVEICTGFFVQKEGESYLKGLFEARNGGSLELKSV